MSIDMTPEHVLAATRQQLNQAMAANAELTALAQLQADRISELEKDDKPVHDEGKAKA
jgi:hypothetical protein